MSEPRTIRPDDAASRIVLGYLAFGFAFVGGTEVLFRATGGDTASWRIVSRLMFLAFSAIFLSFVIGRELRLRQQAERQVRELYGAEHRARLGEEHARRHLTLHAKVAEALSGEVDSTALERLGDVLVPEVADLAVLVRFEDDADVVLASTSGEAIDAESFARLLTDPTWRRALHAESTRTGPELMTDGDASAGDLLLAPLVGHGAHSVARVPVDLGESKGLLLSATAGRRRGFRPSDLDALASVADRVSLRVQAAALQDASRAATERLAALVQHSPVGIIDFDPHGVVRAANPSAIEILGGNGTVDVHPDLRATLDDVRHRLASGETVLGSELTTKRSDGSEVDVWMAASLLSSADPRSGTLLVVLADVTERRRLRGRVEQAQRLEALGQMAGAVAHDYNNLLTVILGYTELVERQLGSDHPSVPDLQAVRSAGEQAQTLADHLLTVSRRRIVEPEVLDPTMVIEHLHTLLPRLVGPGIEVQVTTDARIGRVLADRGQLESTLLNLAVNARDAMGDRGTLRLLTGPATLEDGTAAVSIVVADDGAGMAPEVVARCFEPFFTTKHRSDGSGLGLAMVHAAVTQAGGTVQVETELGRGTAFMIVLPITETPLPSRSVGDPAVGGSERILLVEDEPGVRSYARNVFESAGYTVTTAVDADDAEQQVVDGIELDMMVTDVVMPGRSGVALARSIAGLRPSVPVLFVSGFAEDPALHEAGRHAAFLAKPFSPDALLAAAREVLDQAATGAAGQGSNR